MPLSQLLPGPATMSDSSTILPAHIEETIQAIAKLQAEALNFGDLTPQEARAGRRRARVHQIPPVPPGR